VHEAPLLSQEGRLLRQEKSREATFKGAVGVVPVPNPFNIVVKEPPRRASRVTPPDSGGELCAIFWVGHSFTRPHGRGYTLAALRA
jgi:hypothetical protein